MSKNLIFKSFVVFLLAALPTHAEVWQPSQGHAQVPIWPEKVPDSEVAPGPESVETPATQVVAGKSWSGILNVTRPTMTVYSPKGKNTGAAVVVFPGGGFVELVVSLFNHAG